MNSFSVGKEGGDGIGSSAFFLLAAAAAPISADNYTIRLFVCLLAAAACNKAIDGSYDNCLSGRLAFLALSFSLFAIIWPILLFAHFIKSFTSSFFVFLSIYTFVLYLFSFLLVALSICLSVCHLQCLHYSSYLLYFVFAVYDFLSDLLFFALFEFVFYCSFR